MARGHSKDLNQYVGARVEYPVDELHFEVEIVETRANFGRIDCLIRPLTGYGEKWVTVRNLVFPGNEDPFDLF